MIFRVLHYNPLSANQLRLEEILQATRNFSIVGLVATQRRAPVGLDIGSALVNSSCISGLNRCHRALGPSAWWGVRRPELVQPAGAIDAHYEHSEVCSTKLLGSFFFSLSLPDRNLVTSMRVHFHFHHKWQPQKSWTLYQGYQDAQDKQQTQYPLTTMSKWKTALLRIPKSECPDIWIRLPKHKWSKSSSMEDPVVPLERNLYGHPLAGLLWERQFEKVLWEHGLEKVLNWACVFFTQEKKNILIRVCGRYPTGR